MVCDCNRSINDKVYGQKKNSSDFLLRLNKYNLSLYGIVSIKISIVLNVFYMYFCILSKIKLILKNYKFQ